MQPDAHEIAHVSDTALMTAAYSAMETERPDGLIRDPFAAQLAGERGTAIGRALTGGWTGCTSGSAYAAVS